jgi:hypothetical protein
MVACRVLSTRILIAALTGISSSADAAAADANGFIMGGHVGALGCPEFLNAMATARQRGGLQSVAGVNIINAWMSYVAGFQTGFNSEADGIYDIFKSLNNPSNVLYAIEPWCASHPDKSFADALLVLAYSLRAKMTGTR